VRSHGAMRVAAVKRKHALWFAGVLASFVLLPAADVLLGRDLTPETEVLFRVSEFYCD